MLKFDKEDLRYKEQDFFVGLSDQWEKTNKAWLIALLVALVISVPIGVGVSSIFARQFISEYHPPEVFLDRYDPLDLEVTRIGLLPVDDGVYSSFAQVLNPNPNLSAHRMNYSFVFKADDGEEVKRVSGESYILAGDSRFIVLPRVELEEADKVELVFDEIRWTNRIPNFNPKFSVLEQSSGTNTEGKFFVQSLIRNNEGFEVRSIDVAILVFDRSNQKIIAVNATVLNHLLALENRFFRAMWPVDFPAAGVVQIEPSVNPFDPGLQLEETEPTQVR